MFSKSKSLGDGGPRQDRQTLEFARTGDRRRTRAGESGSISRLSAAAPGKSSRSQADLAVVPERSHCGQAFPALDDIQVDVELIKDTAHDVIDDVVNVLGMVVKGRQRRQYGGTHPGEF